jgi:hypothetical protein
MCASSEELASNHWSNIRLLFHGADNETITQIMYAGTFGYPVYGKRNSEGEHDQDQSRLAFADQVAVGDVFIRDALQESNRVVLSLVQMNKLYPSRMTFGEFYQDRKRVIQQALEAGCDAIALKPVDFTHGGRPMEMYVSLSFTHCVPAYVCQYSR